jgi:hypothetical protein
MSTTKAFFISGHGDQDAGIFIVPEGCYVVVKKEVCRLANSYTFHDDFDNLLKMNMDDILHPLHNSPLHPEIKEAITELRNAFGDSPTIYAPGMQCPNFRYYLCNVHVYDDYILLDDYVGSGIIDIRSVKECRKTNDKPMEHFITIRKEDKYNGTKEGLIKEIIKLYHYCVYPQKPDIENYLNERWAGVERVTPYEMVKDLSSTQTPYFKEIIRVTQQQLCQASPGVFYHNVCRALSSKLQHHGIQLNQFKNPNSNGPHPTALNMLYNPMYRRLISESLSRRCTEKRYQNSTYARRKLYQSAVHNCSYLEERLEAIEKAKRNINTSNDSNNEKNRRRLEIVKEMKLEIMTIALHNARQRCKQYSNNIPTTRRSREREGNRNRSSNNNNRRRRNRSRSPTRGGKNKTHRKRR